MEKNLTSNIPPDPVPKAEIASEIKPEEKIQPEKKNFESLDNVSEILDQWMEQYKDEKTPESEKLILSYKMQQMHMALSLSHLKAENVKLRSDGSTVGFYTDDRQVALTESGINLDAKFYRDVLYHEATHAGDTTGHRIFDEGFAEIVTKMKINEMIGGYYENEQEKVKRAFGQGQLKKAAKIYDYDHPAKLALYYLTVELYDLWQNKLKSEYKRESETTDFDDKEFLKSKIGELGGIEKLFNSAVPDLRSRLTDFGFDFKTAEKEILEHLFDQAR